MMITQYVLDLVPKTSRRSNPSILKEINPKYSLQGLMLNLQYLGLIEKDFDMGKIEEEGKEEKGAKVDKMVGWQHRLN